MGLIHRLQRRICSKKQPVTREGYPRQVQARAYKHTGRARMTNEELALKVRAGDATANAGAMATGEAPLPDHDAQVLRRSRGKQGH